MNFYNEIDLFAAQWLRNLAGAGHIIRGQVDDRSICEIEPIDVPRFGQAHFFAGIGVWSWALRLAGWPDDVPVWTGSCPCQPFSTAGKRSGTFDDRHLWPEWFRLIRQCRPPVVFGEQVAGKGGFEWFDTVSGDLEREDYAVAAASISAGGAGAPHKRQRLYFVAYSNEARRRGIGGAWISGDGIPPQWNDAVGCRETCGLDDPDHARLERRRVSRNRSYKWVTGEAGLGSFWSNAEWIYCADEKWRAVEPGTLPLVNGASSAVGRLRAYGNALCAETAAAFVRAVMDSLDLVTILG